jgi:ribosomal protein L7/L12
MSAVVVNWPDEWHVATVAEVMDWINLDEGDAERVVDIVAMCMARGIVSGLVRVGEEIPVRPDVPPDHIVTQARALVRQERWIQAIKLLREHSTLGLKEGKAIVDRMRAEVGGG